MKTVHTLKDRSAFTIVELLVVIAIILLLISLTVPGVNRARENAYRTKCLSNLRQIGVIVFEAIVDESGRLPWATPPPANAPQHAFSYGLIERGLFNENPAVLTCPTRFQVLYGHPRPYISQAPINTVNGGDRNSLRNSYNWASSGGGLFPGGATRVDLSQIPSPSTAFIACDQAGGTFYGTVLTWSHVGGGNAVFFDGHAEWIPSERWEVIQTWLAYPYRFNM